MGTEVEGLRSLVLVIHHSNAIGILHSVFTLDTYPQRLDPGQSILKGQSPPKCCRIHCTSLIDSRTSGLGFSYCAVQKNCSP